MKALTISQPFASLIASGEKWIENRTWDFDEGIDFAFAVRVVRSADFVGVDWASIAPGEK